jgi:hypothetical protein
MHGNRWYYHIILLSWLCGWGVAGDCYYQHHSSHIRERLPGAASLLSSKKEVSHKQKQCLILLTSTSTSQAATKKSEDTTSMIMATWPTASHQTWRCKKMTARNRPTSTTGDHQKQVLLLVYSTRRTRSAFTIAWVYYYHPPAASSRHLAAMIVVSSHLTTSLHSPWFDIIWLILVHLLNPLLDGCRSAKDSSIEDLLPSSCYLVPLMLLLHLFIHGATAACWYQLALKEPCFDYIVAWALLTMHAEPS